MIANHTDEIVRIKRKPIVVGKTFRLFDYVVYDEIPVMEETNSSDEEKPRKNSYKDDYKFVIQMFGINETGETCSIYIDDFNPFFFIKVNDNWNESTLATFTRFIRSEMGKYYEHSIVKSELVQYQKLYGFFLGFSSSEEFVSSITGISSYTT